MWAVRRSLNYVRHRGEYGNALRACANLLDGWKCNANASLSSNEGALVQQHEHGGRSVCSAVYVYGRLIEVERGFASRATAKNGDVDKSEVNSRDDEREEVGFSELDSHPSHEALPSESESDMVEAEEEVEVDPYLSEVEGEEAAARAVGKNKKRLSQVVVIVNSYKAFRSKLDKWIQDGNAVTKEEAHFALRCLQRQKMFVRALQVTEWLWEKKAFTFEKSDYASHLNLIAKVYGIYRAEKYFATIPSEMRGYNMYRILLANCSRLKNIEKTEKVLNKMKDAGYSLSVFEYNSLLLLYKWMDKKKICSVLEKMEHEGVKPDLLTYKHLIDAKGWAGDIVGMEQILENMKAKGIVTDAYTSALLAKHYIRAGNTKKAEAFMKELENNGSSKEGERYIQRILLPLYADLGKVGEVERVWKEIESASKLFLTDYIAGIRAWGKLVDIEKAEIIFEKLLSSEKKLASHKACNVLLNVYADHHLLLKGEEFVKRMFDSGIAIDPSIWETLAKLYVNSGDVEKADCVLFKACQQNKVKPNYGTMLAVLEKYAERGDIANAEKIFDRLTTLGYGGRLKSYESLLEAYIKARVPAYGFKERMVAAEVSPNRRISNLLQKMDAFKKDSLKKDLISDILD